MTNGLVSTIIPVYNRPALLKECVESVLAQTYRPIEIIIVDDGSTDETADVAEQLEASNPESIATIHQQNAGPGASREAGRVVANGEFIQYLDSDDVLLSGKFQCQVESLNNNPDCQVVYGKTRFRFRDGQIAEGPWKRTGERIETMFPSFLQSRWWSTPNPIYRASVCNEAGPWTSLRQEEDWEYDCRIAATGVKLCYVGKYVCEVRDHDQGRLSQCWEDDGDKLRNRARAHELIFSHARKAGIELFTPEMQHFAKELFLLSRQCGAAGLSQESRQLFSLSRSAATESSAKGFDYKLYRTGAALLGWSRMGSLSAMVDRFRRS